MKYNRGSVWFTSQSQHVYVLLVEDHIFYYWLIQKNQNFKRSYKKGSSESGENEFVLWFSYDCQSLHCPGWILNHNIINNIRIQYLEMRLQIIFFILNTFLKKYIFLLFCVHKKTYSENIMNSISVPWFLHVSFCFEREILSVGRALKIHTKKANCAFSIFNTFQI